MNSRFLLVATVLAIFVLPQTSAAQQAKPWEQIPIPQLHAFHPQQPKRIELKNGIVIFLQEDHELPFISGSVLIPGGSRDETTAKAGLVGLYSQAWRTSGTATMDGDAMDDLLESKAAHIETEGDDDSTALSWDSLKGDADQVFSLAMDLLFHPKFSAEKLELGTAAGSHLQSSAATTTKTRSPVRESAKLVYGVNSPYTRQPELATIGAVTLADLQAWHDRTTRRASSSSASAATSTPWPWRPKCAPPSKAFRPSRRSRLATTSSPAPRPASTSSTRTT